MLKEFLGLLADVNPAEIASHIAQGNLHEWCNSWKSAAEQYAGRSLDTDEMAAIRRMMEYDGNAGTP